MTTRVVHCKIDSYDLYIGRPSKWGNPFVLGKDGNRAEVIAKYEGWVRQQANLMASLHELRGKTLGCYCKPLDCHGDILVKLLWEIDNPPPIEVAVGRYYKVHFIDPNYPCHCPCHQPGLNVMHCMPCCYDLSYSGPAYCQQKLDEDWFIFQLPNRNDDYIIGNRVLKLHRNSVVQEIQNVIR